jgi:hypothetical protein
MNPTQRTIGFLRTLTADGLLSTDEVWSLGKFFQDNPACQNEWPGTLLYPMLGSAFDDNQLSDEEMEVLASTIASIEQEWTEKHPHKEGSSEPLKTLSVIQPAMPKLDLSFEMPVQKEEKSFLVSLLNHTCSCLDWRQRQIWPLAHPGRCCAHIAHAFARTGKPMEPWFQALLDDCFLRGRGTDPVDDWLLIELPKSKPALVSGGPGEWCAVFTAEPKDYERFSFNRLNRRWSFGEAPAAAAAIERTIFEYF